MSAQKPDRVTEVMSLREKGLDVLIRAVEILRKGGFKTSEVCEVRSAFDLVARREELLLLLKVLYNIDCVSEGQASRMKWVSSLLAAFPIIVGERTKNVLLEGGVVYERHGIPAINLETLEQIVMNEEPMVYADRGGYYVRIDGKRLREVRERKGLSRGDLARAIGVSKDTIRQYESGEIDASYEKALLLLEVLKEDEIFLAPELFKRFESNFSIGRVPELVEKVLNEFEKIGFRVYPTMGAPFDVLSKDDDKNREILTSVSKYKVELILKRARVLREVSEVVGAPPLYVVEAPSGTKIKEPVEGVPMINSQKLREVSDKEEVLELISED
ncbi:transcriptional regulator [Thermococci archaeon]|nr:MAG: transcriptional regulator [Thermococci archaeon]